MSRACHGEPIKGPKYRTKRALNWPRSSLATPLPLLSHNVILNRGNGGRWFLVTNTLLDTANATWLVVFCHKVARMISTAAFDHIFSIPVLFADCTSMWWSSSSIKHPINNHEYTSRTRANCAKFSPVRYPPLLPLLFSILRNPSPPICFLKELLAWIWLALYVCQAVSSVAHTTNEKQTTGTRTKEATVDAQKGSKQTFLTGYT